MKVILVDGTTFFKGDFEKMIINNSTLNIFINSLAMIKDEYKIEILFPESDKAYEVFDFLTRELIKKGWFNLLVLNLTSLETKKREELFIKYLMENICSKDYLAIGGHDFEYVDIPKYKIVTLYELKKSKKVESKLLKTGEELNKTMLV